MNRKLDRIQTEIAELQQRRTSRDSKSDWLDAKDRLRCLRELLTANAKEMELRRHSIVASIAALQSFHRGVLVEIMTHDPQSAVRAADILGEKYTLRDTLEYIGGGRLSASELISHLAPANSVDDLMLWMGRLFDDEFASLLSQAVAPLDRHSTDPNVIKIVTSVPDLLSSLSEAFRLRHILAHEAAPKLGIDQEGALQLLQTVETWLDAVDGILWMTVWKEVPLTQVEMNMASMPAIEASRMKLANALRSLRGSLENKRRRSLTINHMDWRKWPLTSSKFLTEIVTAQCGEPSQEACGLTF